MQNKKTLIICQSIHHGNTLKIAKVIAKEISAEIKKPSEVDPKEIKKYDLIGFGSGIYDDKHHKLIFDFIKKIPMQKNKKAFVFSTSGVPIKVFGNNFFVNYTKKCHNYTKEKLSAKGFKIVGEFSCPGFNTNVFLKYIGGINKHRPSEEDFTNAKEFAEKIIKK